jgi:very-short-patch-repair endonuclease
MNDHDFFLNRSRELRKDQTPAEKILWGRLRNRRFGGIKFRRQHVIGPCIADFFCAEVGLVIELDGATHVGKKDSDRLRDEDMAALGLHVYRVWNTEIYDDLECVLEGIWRRYQKLRASKQKTEDAAHLAPSPPASGGEARGEGG